jgi:glutathione S-transferase
VITLYYWPGLPGRGEFIRLLLAVAEQDYVDVGRRDGAKAIADARERFDGFAPPYLEFDNRVLSQTSLILRTLAERYELTGDTPERAEMAVLTLLDFVGEVHNTHHPISTELFSDDQVGDAKRAANLFLAHRLPALLDWITDFGEGNSFWFGGFCYADIVLLQVLDGLVYAFPNAMAREYAARPELLKLRARIDAVPTVRGHRQSIRHVPFTNQGIFRHYPELDP